jgi:hypothetical protein
MCRKLFVLVLIAAGGFWLVKKTNLTSYAGVLWSQVKNETKNAVPTHIELERVRLEIAGMDRDISGMLRPIAEHMAAVNRLKKDIATARVNLAKDKTDLLTMTKDLEGNPTEIEYGNEVYSAARVRAKVQKDFESYKRGETYLKSQEKLLEAKERALGATREQLAKMIGKKKEYEVRLAQLEAEEETLKIARMGTKVKLDDSRATEIEGILSQIEQRHDVQRAELELLNGPSANDFIPVEQRPRGTAKKADLQEIRNYLEGDTTVSQR